MGRRSPGFWASDDCGVWRRNEWDVVSVVGRLLRRRTMGARAQQLERPGNISPRVSLHCRPRPCTRGVKHQVDVSHQQLSLSVRNLELRARVLSRLRLRRLAWAQCLRTAIQRRAESEYSFIG